MEKRIKSILQKCGSKGWIMQATITSSETPSLFQKRITMNVKRTLWQINSHRREARKVSHWTPWWHQRTKVWARHREQSAMSHLGIMIINLYVEMKNLTEVECSYDVMRGEGMLKPLGRNKITPRSFILNTGQTHKKK